MLLAIVIYPPLEGYSLDTHLFPILIAIPTVVMIVLAVWIKLTFRNSRWVSICIGWSCSSLASSFLLLKRSLG